MRHTAPELRHTAPELARMVPDDPHAMRDEMGQLDGAFEGTRPMVDPDERDAAEHEAHTGRQRRVDVERAVTAGQQLRESFERGSVKVRRSVPLRTVMFLLPPLALPALAFDLSPAAVVLVWLTLLWLAAAAGVFSAILFEGNQHLAMRSAERRLEHGPPGWNDKVATGGADDAVQDALLAIGKQLDELDDRIAALVAANGDVSADDLTQTLSHRPQEHWPPDQQYDRYGRSAVPDTDWGESRWRR